MTKKVLSSWRCLLGQLSLLLCLGTMTTSCSDFGDNSMSNNPFTPGGGNTPGGSSSSGLMDLGELSSFTVELNRTTLSESETIPVSDTDEYYNSYIENNFEAKKTTTITFNGSADATIDGLISGDTIDVKGGNVEVHAHSKGFVLSIKGATENGSLKVYSDKKFSLLMNGVSITNPEGSAINIQNGNCFVVLQSDNSLTDGTSATYISQAVTPDYAALVANEDNKAVFFSEDDLRFSGSGSLTINAQNSKGKAALSSDDAIFIRPNTNISISCGSGAGNGIKANDDICIKGGVLNIQVAAAGKKGLSSDALLNIFGGRTTAITTGGVDATDASDPTGCAGIKADSILTIAGGELYLKSTGQGGKGISCDDVINITGGKIRIITEGSKYGTSSNNGWGRPGGQSSSDNTVSPKGIRGDKDVNISGGDIMVRTSGSNAEGIESKASLKFSGGKTAVSAYDDGLNAATSISISDGYVFSISTGEGDGIDSNGSISATGGTLIGIASTMGSEEGIDLENSTFTISNANVISIGGNMMGMGARYSGHYISTNVSGNQGEYVALCNGDKPLLVFALPRTYSNGHLLASTSSLSSGTYTLKANVAPTGGTTWMNFYEGATSVSGGSSTNVTAQ